MDADAEWQPGGVRCWMSSAGQAHGFPGMEKRGVGGWRGHRSLFKSHF